MGLFELFNKWIVERGSAEVQTKHIALFKDELALAEKKATLLEKEILELETENEKLKSDLQESHKETQILQQTALQEQISLAGLVKLIPARKYYPKYDSTITNMLEDAKHSFTMVSVNLMTGLPFAGLISKISDKLRTNKSFTITISLINPSDASLVFQFSKLLDVSSEEFSNMILGTLSKLVKFREEFLNDQEKQRFNIRVHNSIPFASAIIRDIQTENGRLQIETKIYKEPIDSSFALEFVNGTESGLYETLLSGYSQLIKDGSDWAALNQKEF
jgi:hypothetical protein